MRRGLPLLALAALLACESTVSDQNEVGTRQDRDGGVELPAPPPELDRLIHVAPSAGPSADGTRDRPFDSLVAAYALAEPGDVVLLAAGSYGAIEPPPTGVSLRGSGITETVVRGPLALNGGQSVGALTLEGTATLSGNAELVDVLIRRTPAPAVIVVGAARLVDVALREITAGAMPPEDRPDAAVVVRDTGALTWDGGVVQGAAVTAIRVDGGTLAGRALDLSGNRGFGVYQDGGQATLADLRIFEPWGAGLRFIEADAQVDDVRIFEPQIDPDTNTGTGVGFIGSTGRVAHAYVRGGDRAFRAALGADLTLVDAFADRPLSDGVGVGQSAHATIEGLTVVAPRNSGVSINDATATARDVLVRDAGRLGLLVSAGGMLEGDGITVLGQSARSVSVLVSGATLRGLVLEGALDGCLQLTEVTQPVLVEGATLRGCGASGVGVLGEGAPIVLRDVTVEGTYDNGQGFAAGVHIYGGAATIERLTSRANLGIGLQIEESTAVVRDSHLVDNAGPGMVVLGATVRVTVERLTAERNVGAGALVIQSEAVFDAPMIAENIADPELGTGDGIAGFLQAQLTVNGGYSLDNQGSGVSLTQFSRGVIDGGVRLEGNQGWGLEIACDGSATDAAVDAVFAGNHRGPQSACP